MSMITNIGPRISIPGTSSHFLEPTGPGHQGRLRHLTGGSGAPLVMLHTVRTQAEHFPGAGHFIALERPDVPADLLTSVA